MLYFYASEAEEYLVRKLPKQLIVLFQQRISAHNFIRNYSFVETIIHGLSIVFVFKLSLLNMCSS